MHYALDRKYFKCVIDVLMTHKISRKKDEEKNNNNNKFYKTRRFIDTLFNQSTKMGDGSERLCNSPAIEEGEDNYENINRSGGRMKESDNIYIYTNPHGGSKVAAYMRIYLHSNYSCYFFDSCSFLYICINIIFIVLDAN